MKASVRLWIDALRSGEFPQARHALRDQNGYCCLGVACELYRREVGKGRWEDLGFKVGGYAATGTLPLEVRDWLGLESSDGAWSISETLAHRNDLGDSFDQIADIIEREPEGLFA